MDVELIIARRRQYPQKSRRYRKLSIVCSCRFGTRSLSSSDGAGPSFPGYMYSRACT